MKSGVRVNLDKIGKWVYHYIVVKEKITIKIFRETYPKFRLLAALTGEKMMVLFARLIEEETERVKAKEKQC
jgi:hypothetical protein